MWSVYIRAWLRTVISAFPRANHLRHKNMQKKSYWIINADIISIPWVLTMHASVTIYTAHNIIVFRPINFAELFYLLTNKINIVRYLCIKHIYKCIKITRRMPWPYSVGYSSRYTNTDYSGLKFNIRQLFHTSILSISVIVQVRTTFVTKIVGHLNRIYSIEALLSTYNGKVYTIPDAFYSMLGYLLR